MWSHNFDTFLRWVKCKVLGVIKVQTQNLAGKHTHLKVNSSPLKIGLAPKGKDRLPTIMAFRGELLNFGGVVYHFFRELWLVLGLSNWWKSMSQLFFQVFGSKRVIRKCLEQSVFVNIGSELSSTFRKKRHNKDPSRKNWYLYMQDWAS